MTRWNGRLGVIADVATIGMIVLAIGVLVLRRGPSTPPASPLNAVESAPPIEFEELPVMGDQSARVLLIEFSDYQCPFCKRHESVTFPKLKSTYIDTGKIQYAFAHNPLTTIHPFARTIASAAVCAGEQGQFWPMHRRMFAERVDDEHHIASAADAVGLNMPPFVTCLQDPAIGERRVERDIAIARSFGLEATPGFLLARILPSGKAAPLATIKGAQPFDVFSQAIDGALR